MKRICAVLGILLSALLMARADGTNAPAMFKIHLVSPSNYQIFQRTSHEQGKLIIAGSILPGSNDPLPLDALEVRLTGKSFTGVLPGKWQRLPFDARVASFRGVLVAPAGGWYRLEIRALQQKVPVRTNAVEHVGIG